MEVYRFSKPRQFGEGGNGIIEDDFGNVYEVQIEDHRLNFQPSPTAGTIDLVFDYDPTNSEVQFDSVLFPVGMNYSVAELLLTDRSEECVQREQD